MNIDIEKAIYIGAIVIGVAMLISYAIRKRKEKDEDFPRLSEVDDE